MNTITLASGAAIPQLGLGTWELTGTPCTQAVAAAIEMGYRHIDTAFLYENHREVAAGIEQSGIDRKELFLTTKLPMGALKPPQVHEYGQRMLDELRTDYVDLLLIHWPNRKIPFEETLGAMNELIEKGWVGNIGVSNFNSRITVEASEVSPAPVVVNQVEFHPYLYQRELLQTCREHNIAVTAYSPLARGRAVQDERLQQIAEQCHKDHPNFESITPAQVVIAWLLQKGLIVIPKATTKEHLQSNLQAMDIELASQDIAEIDGFPEYDRIIDGSFKHYPFDEQI